MTYPRLGVRGCSAAVLYRTPGALAPFWQGQACQATRGAGLTDTKQF